MAAPRPRFCRASNDTVWLLVWLLPEGYETVASGLNGLLAGNIWWAQVGSNHRLLACKASALPLSYAPLCSGRRRTPRTQSAYRFGVLNRTGRLRAVRWRSCLLGRKPRLVQANWITVPEHAAEGHIAKVADYARAGIEWYWLIDTDQ
jgi:hypothetical protein